MTSGRRFDLRLGLLCLLGLAVQAVGRLLEWPANPLARVPLDDAQVYWDWASAIAGGRLVGDTPFLSAPLYPYALGLLRALGLGLPGVIAVQALLQAATGWLLGRVALRQLGRETPALVAVGLFLLLSDPAYAVGRLQNSTLQLLLVVWLWRRMQLAADEPGRRGEALLGLAAGLNVLANPAMLLALPLIAGWRALRGTVATPVLRALLVLAPAAAAIAPATAHNLAASGEPVLVSAQAGVTFVHGNAPGADGGYHPIPGVSTGRLKQNRDAYRLAAEATGEEGWRSTSRWFLRRGLDWWREQPGEALGVLARKVGLFFGASLVGDVAVPRLEGRAGLRTWEGLVPAPLLLLPAALALLAAALARRAGFAESLLLLLPLLVVAVFFHSPRYRMPALPVAAVLTAGLAFDRSRLRPALLASGLVAVVAGSALEPALDALRPAFEQKLGEAYEREGRLPEAAERYAAAAQLGFPQAAASLGHVLRLQGRAQEGLTALREAAAARPEDGHARRSLGVALAEEGLWAEAEAEFRAAVALDPGDWEARSGLGNVLFETGRTDEAVEQHEAALAARPDFAPGWFNLALVQEARGEDAAAVAAFAAALEHDAGLLPARFALARLHAGSADPAVQDSARANAAARAAADAVRADPAAPPDLVVEMFACLAAARSAAQDFAEAAAYQEEAASIARQAGAPADLVAALERQLADYRAGRGYRHPQP
jgi:Flp pilus assembly protein TadD